MAKRAVVLGSSGQIGRAVVLGLVRTGWEVRTVDRGRRPVPSTWAELGVRRTLLDRDEPGALRAALAAQGGADVLVDTIAYDEAHGRELCALADLVGSAVVVSSAAVYVDEAGRSLSGGLTDFPRFPVPLREDHRTVAPGDSGYAARKAALERVVLRCDALPVTVLRPGAVHGPGSTAPRELWPLLRAVDRRPVVALAHRGAGVFHTASARNLAELVRLAAARPGSRVLNAGDPHPPSVLDIVRWVCQAAGHAPELLLLDGPPLGGGVGATPWSVPHDVVLDLGAAERELSYRPVTTYEDTVRPAVRWLTEALEGRGWREAFPEIVRLYGDGFADYAAEDAVLGGVGT
ncbi:NAD(P)-dependent oxidoreductase [Actinoalloteichus sp. AHMU CJ021]|uniref:Nucleoside-diphosphate-sugar epimerase n=1 Tax=Actinoalloteichus caeruleus DSM 43889 TaxID=1120930 RepID=A0ABT1JQ57_ACTCY|nr:MULTISPECIES: NAD(P)-dependent oxidoreductase [Actinoalloteichus]AUS80391.1 NAD(P)-dependent oxidoreductase [Actinoalloteichus sp. AHMU CJ021]MCP2334653.1 Nucleoside-diphosphate-sugar epimerase [Actinoalloteichus caeruleus DSM 43889]